MDSICKEVKMLKIIKDIFKKKKKKDENTISIPQNIPNNMWVCSHCGTKNDFGAQFCKDCGIYK